MAAVRRAKGLRLPAPVPKRLGLPTHFDVAEYRDVERAFKEQAVKNGEGMAMRELDSTSSPKPPPSARSRSFLSATGCRQRWIISPTSFDPVPWPEDFRRLRRRAAAGTYDPRVSG